MIRPHHLSLAQCLLNRQATESRPNSSGTQYRLGRLRAFGKLSNRRTAAMQWLKNSTLVTIAMLSVGFADSASAQDGFHDSRPTDRNIARPFNDYAPSEAPFGFDNGFETQCPGGYCPSGRSPQGYVCPLEAHGGRGSYHDNPREPVGRFDNGGFGNQADINPSTPDLEAAVEQIFDTVRFQMRRTSGYEDSLTAAWELSRSVRRLTTQRSNDPNFARRDFREVERALVNLRGMLAQSGAPRTLETALTSFERMLADASNGFGAPLPTPSDRIPRFDSNGDHPLPPAIPGTHDTGRDARPRSGGHDHSHSDGHDHSRSGRTPSKSQLSTPGFDEVPPPPSGLPEILGSQPR